MTSAASSSWVHSEFQFRKCFARLFRKRKADFAFFKRNFDGNVRVDGRKRMRKIGLFFVLGKLLACGLGNLFEMFIHSVKRLIFA